VLRCLFRDGADRLEPVRWDDFDAVWGGNVVKQLYLLAIVYEDLEFQWLAEHLRRRHGFQRGGVRRRLPSAERVTPGSSSASRSHSSHVTWRWRWSSASQ
jgi:hypothetical protein